MNSIDSAFRAPSPEEIVSYQRAAVAERALAIGGTYRAIVGWLQRGVALRYSDDAFTHPTAGPLCGC